MKSYVQSNWPRLLVVVAVLTLCVAGALPDNGLAGALATMPGLDPWALGVGGAAVAMIGDTADVGQVKDLLEKQGKAWKEFQDANDKRIKAIEEKGYAPGDVVAQVEKLNVALNDIGKQLNAVEAKANRPAVDGDKDKQETPEQAEYRKAFGRFLRKGDDTGLAELQRKAMSSGSDPDGGYLIVPEMDRAIDRIAPTISAMSRLANVVTIGTSKYEKVVKTSGMTMRRVQDGGTGGETTAPKYAKVAIEVYTAEVEPWVYNETLEDAFINLEADLAEEAAIGFAEGEGSEFITGNGVGTARGITGYDKVANASYAWGSVGFIVSGKSAAFASVAPADKVISLQHALKAQYRPGAVWLTNDTTLGVMRQLKDGSGAYYLWQPDPAAAFGGRFLGHPVEVDDNMPAVGAGSYSLAFGNFKRGYTIVRRSGTSLIRDNITAKGTTKFNFRRRFGGGITHFEAIKLMKFATS